MCVFYECLIAMNISITYQLVMNISQLMPAVSLCTHMCTLLYAHTCAHSYMHTHVHTPTCTRMCTLLHAHACAHSYMHTHVHTPTCTRMCTLLHAHACAHSCPGYHPIRTCILFSRVPLIGWNLRQCLVTAMQSVWPCSTMHTTSGTSLLPLPSSSRSWLS